MNTTIKVSRSLYRAITDRARAGESKDQTVRRELGLEVNPRKPNNSPMLHIKVTESVRDFIRSNSVPPETMDQTLRRLFEAGRQKST